MSWRPTHKELRRHRRGRGRCTYTFTVHAPSDPYLSKHDGKTYRCQLSGSCDGTTHSILIGGEMHAVAGDQR